MGSTGTRCGARVALAGLAVLLGVNAAAAQQGACGRPEFEAVVESAAATLRDLSAKNRPGFQDKLRALKVKRGWSTEEFMREAATYVQDDKITELDQRAGDLLTRINTMGEAGAAAKAPDCKLLAELRGTMWSLVDAQTEKWAYMFAKLEKALWQ